MPPRPGRTLKVRPESHWRPSADPLSLQLASSIDALEEPHPGRRGRFPAELPAWSFRVCSRALISRRWARSSRQVPLAPGKRAFRPRLVRGALRDGRSLLGKTWDRGCQGSPCVDRGPGCWGIHGAPWIPQLGRHPRCLARCPRWGRQHCHPVWPPPRWAAQPIKAPQAPLPPCSLRSTWTCQQLRRVAVSLLREQ